MNKKSILFISLFICLLNSIPALPGVIHSVEDKSGQFVYYKDNSFERESYLGIAYYDEGTYSLRYFAPANLDTYPIQAKKDIQILFSLDVTKKYVELTGEKIISAVTPEDTDIINYIHDMLYELTSRRQKAEIIEAPVTINQDYEQFGGDVNINYDPLIPIFNIKSISSANGKVLFNLVTQGQLVSNKDDSFSAFEGIPLKIEDETHTFKPEKKSKKQKIEYKKFDTITQKITLDSQWSSSAENLYTLGNNAVLVLEVIEFDSGSSQNEKKQYISSLERKLNLGTLASYPYSEITQIDRNKNCVKINNIFFNDLSKTFTKDFKILTQLDENHLAIMTLSVFYGPYSRNNKYFDSIIKSYSVSLN